MGRHRSAGLLERYGLRRSKRRCLFRCSGRRVWRWSMRGAGCAIG
jgi:hypothetical protein